MFNVRVCVFLCVYVCVYVCVHNAYGLYLDGDVDNISVSLQSLIVFTIL